jgi:sec-independent protein translocase protein TatA
MIGTGELLLILGAALILFGGKKLPEFAKNLGLGIREFKKACNGEETPQTPPETEKKE